MAFIKLMLIGLVGLTVVYLSFSVYFSSIRRERLEDEYNEEPVADMSRDDFVEAGMKEYQSGLWPKLLLLVYVVPIVALAVTIYVVNAN